MHFEETVIILSLKYGLNQYPEYVGQNLNSRLHAKKSGVMFLKPLLLPKKHGGRKGEMKLRALNRQDDTYRIGTYF